MELHVGDRVRYVGPIQELVGLTGRIHCIINSTPPYGVEFDSAASTRFHDLSTSSNMVVAGSNAECRPNHGYFCESYELEVIESAQSLGISTSYLQDYSQLRAGLQVIVGENSFGIPVGREATIVNLCGVPPESGKIDGWVVDIQETSSGVMWNIESSQLMLANVQGEQEKIPPIFRAGDKVQLAMTIPEYENAGLCFNDCGVVRSVTTRGAVFVDFPYRADNIEINQVDLVNCDDCTYSDFVFSEKSKSKMRSELPEPDDIIKLRKMPPSTLGCFLDMQIGELARITYAYVDNGTVDVIDESGRYYNCIPWLCFEQTNETFAEKHGEPAPDEECEPDQPAEPETKTENIEDVGDTQVKLSYPDNNTIVQLKVDDDEVSINSTEPQKEFPSIRID